jgi:hypothetical protein
LLSLVPDADDVTGGWTNELGGLPLYPSVDELVADDANNIQSSLAPSADICRLNLSDPPAGAGQPVSVSYRYKRQGSGAGTINIVVSLKQGSTVIASWTHNNIPTSFVTTTQTLSGAEFAAISDFRDLHIEIQADAA